ncbi:transport and Golgi organization protein 1 isoform X2 [Neocloeon triangulifer]|uniref:transport and Golgi organization protein 1 isoform X2 n=1 Tax=Neocloeon triangulifer TaxID=2078957 RepID=UPI00286EFD9F|nr:transport and Golgi organization protein 1 isoform X2 [Neocloeon triangulifer]
MHIFAKFLVLCSLSVFLLVHARISDQRLCVDENCSVPVSIARSVLSYNSDDARILSFKPSDKIVIYSKSAGKNTDLWGAEIDGKRGYVPKSLIREQKILNSNLKYTVPTELGLEQLAQQAEKASADENKVDEVTDKPFAPTPLPDANEETKEPNVIVVDGTTIYMPEDAEIGKTVTPVEQTRPPPPPPDTIPPSPQMTATATPPTEEEPAVEHATPEPETPPLEEEKEDDELLNKDKTDGVSMEAVSEPPELAKDDSVMEYLSDTLTGWLESSGDGGSKETVDTGQEEVVGEMEETQEQATETVTPEPPEDKTVDLSEINLLSAKASIQEQTPESDLETHQEEIPTAKQILPEEPPVQTVPDPYQETVDAPSSDEINYQYSSYPSITQPEHDIPIPTENIPIEEDATQSIDSAEQLSSSEVPLYSEEVTTETTFNSIEEVTSEETASVETENLKLVEVVKDEDITFSPYQNYETGQVIEDTITVPSAPVVEENDLPVVEETTDPYVAPAVEESTTVLPQVLETSESEKTVEETIENPSDDETQEEEVGIFADWVYNLFGSSSKEEKKIDATPEEVITEKLLAEEEQPAEEGLSTGSWFWSSSVAPDEPVTEETEKACDAVSCGNIGVTPTQQAEVPADSYTHYPHQQPHSEQQVSAMDWDTVATSGTLLYLVITAITVLLFTLGHYYIEKMKRDGALISKINNLQRELMVSTKECLILKEDLQNTNEKLSGIETTTTDSSEAILEIRAELVESQRLCEEQEEQIKSLESELEAATEAGLELNKMLSEFLSTQRGSQDLVKSVELLQTQLNKQQATISSMNQALSAKTEENEKVKAELDASNEKIYELEEEIASMTDSLERTQGEKNALKQELEEACNTLANQLQEATNLREVEVDALKKKLAGSEASLAESQNSLKHRNSELEVLRESIGKLETMSDVNSDKANKKLEAMLDVSKAQAELKLLRSERDVLKERLQCEEDARQLLEDHVRVIKAEVEKLHERGEAAEREKQDALTRLEVLSDYFKEKEAQLQKELGFQEAICVRKNEDASSTQTRIKSLEEEIENYNCNDMRIQRQNSIDFPNIKNITNNKFSKQWPPRPATPVKIVHHSPVKITGTQNETLKHEIIDQERSLKGQISTLEKKAHENWIAARQAERKLDETKQESSTLRNRLTMLEKGTSLVQNGEDGKGAPLRSMESNGGELPTSPGLHIGDSPTPHYMLPPPPPLSAFMPPPPPPEYMQSPPPPLPLYPDRRPPPLGRMSSPPPHHFSPPPPDRYNSSPYRPRSPASDRSLPRYRYGSRSPSPPPYGGGNHDYPPYHSAGRPWEESRAGFRPVPRDKELKGSTVSSGHSSSDSVGKSSSHRSGKRGK